MQELRGQPLQMLAYVATLAVVALALAAGLVLLGYGLEAPFVVVALASAAAIGERWAVPLSATTTLSVYLLPTVLAAVVIGPLAAGVVAAASMLGDSEVWRAAPERSPRLKWFTYTCTSFITGACAGLTAAGMTVIIPGTTGGIVAASFAAMAVAEGIDLGFAILTAQIRGKRMRQLAGAAAPVAVTSFLVYAPVVAGLAVAYETVSPWTLPLFLVPALAFQRLYTLYQRERSLTDELRTANETLERANLSFAGALIATLDARDRYTAGHSAAVAIYSRDIAVTMGLDADTQERAYLCGLVHDIGKIGLPAGLLEKPGALTLEERRLMQEHSAIGERILKNVDDYSDIAVIVRHHHERIDGEGYPDGISSMDIPQISRIIAVADAYNAMTSDRPYRDAMPSRVARLRLAQAAGTQFDTSIVVAFETVLATASEDYRLARRADFREFARAAMDDYRQEAALEPTPHVASVA
jgi:HD-GYP domain-containing protein (c-di-GMP phosphodiesterase class II)